MNYEELSKELKCLILNKKNPKIDKILVYMDIVDSLDKITGEELDEILVMLEKQKERCIPLNLFVDGFI